MLDGADGLNKMAASLVGQGMAILDAVRGGFAPTAETPSDGVAQKALNGTESASAGLTTGAR